jgi:hypothetical protein
MPPVKKPPKTSKAPSIKNKATTGKPVTPSGSGVVLGRTAYKKTNKVNMANPAKDRNWWEGAANQSHDQPHDMMRLSAGLHQLADSLYRPGTEPDRPIRKSSGFGDRRLYESRGNGAKASNANTKKTGAAEVTNKKTTAARMPNGRRKGN